VAACGLLPASSLTVRLPVRVPVAPGVKVTLIVQVFPATKDDPQVFVCAKSPEVAIDAIFRATLWLFLSEAVVGVLVVETTSDSNERLAGVIVAGAMPVPLREAVCGLLLASSATVSVPVRLPLAVGVNVMPIEQLAPTANDPPQVLVSAKSPDVAIDEIFRITA
jgi:hypothetical protein